MNLRFQVQRPNHLATLPPFSMRNLIVYDDFSIFFSKRGASTLGQDVECKSEPAEKMPRKDSDNGDDVGDVEMDNKEAVKTVTIKKRKEVSDKKKRYLPVVKNNPRDFQIKQLFHACVYMYCIASFGGSKISGIATCSFG